MTRVVTSLQEIHPDSIRQNPDNPRLIFLEEEMNELLESIREVGVKVPISVYSDGNHYTLLDGERRWRCDSRIWHGAEKIMSAAARAKISAAAKR